MSGGVDSSVVAAWLCSQGFDVIGLTFQFTPKAGMNSQHSEFGGCCTINDVHDAKAVAAKLKIPHYVVNDRDRFSEHVIQDFITSYQEGRTPNPCVRCNQYMKFDILERYARAVEADWIATGHYARVTADRETRRYELRRGLDLNKDQSYVLFPLTQSVLERLWLPLGGMSKEETRRLAEQLELATAHKPDSQEICFVQNDRYTDFLAEQGVVMKSGPIKTETGQVLGEHQGISAYTVGQRKGLGIASPAGGEARRGRPSPWYVKAIDVPNNSVVVAEKRNVFAVGCSVTDVHWIDGAPLNQTLNVEAKVRSHSTPAKAIMEVQQDGTVELQFDAPQWAVTPGQFAVWYAGDRVLGGGTISCARFT